MHGKNIIIMSHCCQKEENFLYNKKRLLWSRRIIMMYLLHHCAVDSVECPFSQHLHCVRLGHSEHHPQLVRLNLSWAQQHIATTSLQFFHTNGSRAVIKPHFKYIHKSSLERLEVVFNIYVYLGFNPAVIAELP